MIEHDPRNIKGYENLIEVLGEDLGHPLYECVGRRMHLEAEFTKVCELIHWPRCWDTSVYPTLESAMSEWIAWQGEFKCNGYECEVEP